MAILHGKFVKKDFSLSGGPTFSGSFNTPAFQLAELSQIMCGPNSESDVYDISLVDADGFTVFQRDDKTGTISETDVNIPLEGIYTVTIGDTTVSGPFDFKLESHSLRLSGTVSI